MGFRDDMAVEADAKIGPDRDRWGRPLLIPKGGEDRRPYTRVSTLSDFASGVKTGLETWKRRQSAVGLAQREDIAAMVAALPPLETEDAKTDQVTKAQLDEYLELAHEAAGANAKANYGTAIHAFTEQTSMPPNVPDRMKADVEAYYSTLDMFGIQVVASELFIANDVIMAAGTMDHLLLLPDGRVVPADKKTGRIDVVDNAVQISAYAFGDAYDWRDDTRTDLDAIAESVGGRYCPSTGFTIHIPAGEGTCELIPLNLEEGWRLAYDAAKIHQRRSAAYRPKFLSSDDNPLFIAIHAAKTRDDLQRLAALVAGNEDATSEARRRWAELA